MAQSGTEWKPSRIQEKVAQMLINPEDRRPKSKKLEEAGVPRRTFYNWMKGKHFLDYLNAQVDLYTDGELPEVWRALIRQCERGDTQAIKLYFEMKNKYRQSVDIGNNGEAFEVNIKVVE